MNERTTTPAERSTIARVRALRQHAKMTPEEAAEHTRKAREAREQLYLNRAHGDPVKAAKLRQADMLELSLKSAQARRRAKEQTAIAEAAEAELGEVS